MYVVSCGGARAAPRPRASAARIRATMLGLLPFVAVSSLPALLLPPPTPTLGHGGAAAGWPSIVGMPDLSLELKTDDDDDGSLGHALATTRAQLHAAVDRGDLGMAESLLRRLRAAAEAAAAVPPPQQANATAALPLLFMDPSDLVEPWGKQELVATPATDVSSLYDDCNFSVPGLRTLLQGGLLAPNPLRKAAGFELFFSSPSELPHLGPGGSQPTPHGQPPSAAHTLQRGLLNNTDLAKLPGHAAYNETTTSFTNKTAGALACQSRCDADPRCNAWVYNKGCGTRACLRRPQRCALLDARSCATPTPNKYCISGAKTTGPCKAGLPAGDSGVPHSVYFMTTPDFKAYSTPIRVGSLNQFTAGTHSWQHKPIEACIPKSMARSDNGSAYTIMTICNDVGLRPMVATGGVMGLDAFSKQNPSAAFWDHDDNNLGFSNGQFVDLQITFQNQTTNGFNGSGLKYCDNVGLTRCHEGYRRVVTLRTSTDGLNWTNRAACPDEVWSPHQIGEKFDPQFRSCKGGWNAQGMIVPEGGSSGSSIDFASAATTDPPELEFYKLTPMFVGETKRLVGHALLYAPAPQSNLGPSYGMQPARCKPPYATCHGPHIGVERWIGPADGNLSAMPMQVGHHTPP